jgi:Acyclic terpene utilisation family protein AtuA
MAIKAVAATGMIGTGFDRESLRSGIKGADFIGCDAGSSDPGPYYLGSGESQVAPEAAARDLDAILELALPAKVPVVIGSAGTAGGRPHLERTLDIIRDIARERKWHFNLASIDCEPDRQALLDGYRDGCISPLDPAPPLDEEVLHDAARIVAMIGVEPFQAALRKGADVVVAGRASDTSIYAAIPVERGIPKWVAWHSGKILECGAASVERRLHPDSMVAELDSDGFTIYPPNPAMRCTPASVVAHSLYETSDPYHLTEPGGMLNTTECSYEPLDERSVRVGGGQFVSSPDYTVRLEGARLRGYRAIALAGIRDPLVVRQLDHFLEEVRAVIMQKVADSLRIDASDFILQWRVYGRNGSMGPLEPDPVVQGQEVGLVIDAVAATQHAASSIISLAWHTVLHHPIPEYSGLISNLALPYSPPGIDVGPVYEFCLNHIWRLDDPVSHFPITMERV